MSNFTTLSPNADYQLSVQVEPEYLPDESSPAEARWVFAYHVTIVNTGRVAAQVVARHWIITDGHGQVTEVKGLAVVGHQPVLEPGEQFSYSSGTPLATAEGSMQGSFFCVAVDGERFEAPIAPVPLSASMASAAHGGSGAKSHTLH